MRGNHFIGQEMDIRPLGPSCMQAGAGLAGIRPDCPGCKPDIWVLKQARGRAGWVKGARSGWLGGWIASRTPGLTAEASDAKPVVRAEAVRLSR